MKMAIHTESFVKELGQDFVEDVVCLEAASFVDVWSASQYSAFLESGAGRIFGLIEGKDVVAYVAFQIVFDEAEIVNIAVDTALRGQGRGRILLETALCQLDEAGIGVVFLEVRPSNTAARRLYERCGFSLAGRRKQYYADTKEDALIYRRESIKSQSCHGEE